MRLLAMILLTFWLALPAQAQVCNFTNTGVDFGSVSLNSGGFQSANGTFTASCTGTPNQTITICANFNQGTGGAASGGDPRYLTQGSSRLNYNLFRTNGVGQVWGSYTWGASPRPPSISINLGANGSGSTSQTIYGRLYNGQGATGTGTFQSFFSGSHSQIDYGYASTFNCSSTLSPRVVNVPFVVRVTNNSSCTVSTSALDFGSQPNLNSAKTATNTVTVTCTGGTLYSVGLNNGTSGATSPSARRMTNAATAGSVTYGIYRDTLRLLPWGDTVGTNTVAGLGTGLPQSYTGYGHVPAQTTPPSLTYTDTVIVTVTY